MSELNLNVKAESFEFQYVAGFRKNSKLLLLTNERQLFKIKSKSAEASRYTCYINNCNVTLNVSNDGTCTQLSINCTHNHPPPEDLIKKLSLINSVKDQCGKKGLKRKGVREIFDEECQNDVDAATLVNFSKIRRQLFKIRREGMPKNPRTPLEAKLLFDDDEFLTEYGLSKLNKMPFYRQTIIEDNFAYSVFLSPTIPDLIQKSAGERHYSLDGTFDTVPSCGYKQLLVVHFHFMNRTFPFIYILMSRKSRVAYEHLFGFINQNLFKFEAASFMTDYELALRKALKAVFPNANLKGCWFHYCQALRRNSMKIKRLKPMLSGNVDCYKWYRTFQSLPLVEPNQIEQMLVNLKTNLLNLPKANHGELQQFLQYFEKEWMIKTTPQAFSVYDQNIKTTSSLESFNALLAQKLQKHGEFYKFLEVIRDEDFAASVTLGNATQGILNALTEQRKKQKIKEKRLQDLMDLLKDNKITLDEFFRCQQGK